MKNKLTFIILLFPYLVSSQIKKGDIYIQTSIQGTVSLNQSGNSNTNVYSIPLFKLGIGKFITKNTALGLQILGVYNPNESYNDKYNLKFGFGITHCYAYPLIKNWGFLWKNEINYSKGRLKFFPSVIDNTIVHEMNASSSAGLYYLVLNRLLINASFDMLNLVYTKEDSDNGIRDFQIKHHYTDFKLTGFLPGNINLTNIQIKLAYFIYKKH